MYHTTRNYLKYGNEWDEVESTYKEHKTLEQAKAYAHRYSVGRKFLSCIVEDEEGNEVYELIAGN